MYKAKTLLNMSFAHYGARITISKNFIVKKFGTKIETFLLSKK
jgi:hypothetical protein